MKLGKIQKEWIQSLRDNPEKQERLYLGSCKIDDKNDYKACCLGQMGLIFSKYGIGNVKFLENILADVKNNNCTAVLLNSFSEFGLKTPCGSFKNLVKIKDIWFTSLSDMNDGGMTWPEIADYVQENPENVFEFSI